MLEEIEILINIVNINFLVIEKSGKKLTQLIFEAKERSAKETERISGISIQWLCRTALDFRKLI